MGCSHSELIAVGAKKETNGNALDNAKFTQKEIELIRSSWKLIDDKKEFGMQLMIKAFLDHEDIQERWIFAHDLKTPQEVRDHPQLVYHATKISNVLNKSILTIEELEEAPYFLGLKKLGQNHHTYGVRPNDFMFFEESFQYCLDKHFKNQNILTEEMNNAYKKLFWKIAKKMADGIFSGQIEDIKDQSKNKKEVNKLHPF